MSMEINGSYNHSKANYAEQMKEKRSLSEAEKAKETNERTNAAKVSDKVSEPHDEYISSEKSGTKPTGLYRVGQDAEGNKKIFFDNPKKPGNADGKGQNKVNGGNPEKSEEKCIANTDKVEREIRKLKEKKRQLEQQIRSASGDEKKVRELEKKLAQVENELSQKDNDTYRRQNVSVARG